MTDLTDFAENAALVALLGTGTFYISLHSADPGETGAANELAVANGYARQPDTFTVVASLADNDSAISFGPATSDQGTITHYGVWDAVTGGNCLFKTALDTPAAWSGGTMDAIAGAVSLALD